MLIDKIANLNSSTRNTFFIATVIMTVAVMYNRIVSPHLACLFATQRYESVVSKAVEKNEVIIREVEAKTNKLKKLNEHFEKSCSVLFTPKEAKAFLSDLQIVVEDTGCSVNSLNLVIGNTSRRKSMQPENSLNIVANSAMLSVLGRYNNIIRLMKKLQNNEKSIWIDSFQMQTTNLNSAQLKCDMTITIYTIQDKGDAL